MILLKEMQNAQKRESLKPIADNFAKDKRFISAVQNIDFDALSTNLDVFIKNIRLYNQTHRAERRLMSIKIGKGSINKKHEAALKEAMPQAIENYTTGFKALGDILKDIEQAGMIPVLDEKLHLITGLLKNDEHPLSLAIENYIKANLGCSRQMMDEFKREFAPYNYDFKQILGGSIANAFEIMPESVEAQVSIMEYTAENGLSYLRGKCGPPAWAVLVSKLLASIGITIAAWAVVAIIVALLALLVIICTTVEATWVKNLCQKLNFKLTGLTF